ncbi:MAG: hypothetical protein EPO41_13720, partial [Reyranella sp.]|uniref:hypothetical protein n=1 Tax=Reyranella sp. TaxID=1929291 RepID=UPI00120FCF2F
MFGRIVLLLIFVLVGSCSGDLPSSSMDGARAERAFGLLRSSASLVALMRDRDIRPPDLSAPDPLQQLRQELAKSDPSGAFAGMTYDLTRGNTLTVDWLVQTPNRWGRRADDLTWFAMGCKECEPDISLPICATDADCNGGTCAAIWPRTPGRRTTARKVCLGHSDALPVRIHDLVASARDSVDIVELQPAPSGRFTAALRAAIAQLAFSRRKVEVRVLIGQFPPEGVDAAAFLKELVETARSVPGSRVTVSVSAMRSCTVLESCNSFSWNHGKFIVVDGR